LQECLQTETGVETLQIHGLALTPAPTLRNHCLSILVYVKAK